MDYLRGLVADPTEGPRKLVVKRHTQRTEFSLSPGRIGINMEMRFVPDAEAGSYSPAK